MLKPTETTPSADIMLKTVKYSLHSNGQTGWQFVTAPVAESQRDVFERALEAYGVDEADANSFWKVGDQVDHNSTHYVGGTESTVSMSGRKPGTELIYVVRNIPEVSSDAKVMLNNFFADTEDVSRLWVGDDKDRLSERAQSGMDELMGANILELSDAPGGGRVYSTTEFGMAYPRNTPGFMRNNDNFLHTAPVIDAADNEPADEPGM
jgi:hypothetical protein